jgi:DivIVA domain-containing protein
VYLLVMIGVAAVVFVAAALIFGRGEELAPLPPGHTPTRLPFGEISGDDVRAVRFQQVLRGYRMSEVDWLLDRLAAELDRTQIERAELRSLLDELERPPPGPDGSEPGRPAPRADEPDRRAERVDDRERPAPKADEPERAAPKAGEVERPAPGPRQMLSRETEDAGER